MTKEEKICFQLGHSASAAGLPFAPCFDRNMDDMISKSQSVRGLKRDLRNMSAWTIGYMRQYVLDGKLLNADIFERALIGMFPNEQGDPFQSWLEFVEDTAENGLCVDFQAEPDMETVKAHWYDTLLAGFYRLKADYGEAAAMGVLELGLEGLCLYPYEFEKAAIQLSKGVSPEKLGESMRDGLLEHETAEFPKLRDVLNVDVPIQGPQLNMNF